MNSDIVVLILNCKKYKQKAEFQRQTWLRDIETNTQNAGASLVYYHVIGDPEMDTPYMFDHSGHWLYVKVKDDYCSLPAKVISAFAAVNEIYTYKYIFKTDDDQILIKPTFMGMFFKLLVAKGANYGGYCLTVPDHYSSYYLVHNELPQKLFLEKTTYCNGRFYALSPAAIQALLHERNNISQRVIEDHAIGFYLPEEFKASLLSFDSNQVFIDVEKFMA